MSTAWIRASLALWRRRERARKKLHTRAQSDLVKARAGRAGEFTINRLTERRDLRSRQLQEARDKVALRERQLTERSGPRIFKRAQAGIARPTRSFGLLGPLHHVTVHHAAGPRAPSASEAIRLNGQYDADHRAKNWGGLGYHETIDDLGNLYVSHRGLDGLTGAHTGLANTGNYGILVHGNYETMTPTAAALRTLRWRIDHGHERGLPDLRGLAVRGHRDWPAHTSNLCPGRHLHPHVKEL